LDNVTHSLVGLLFAETLLRLGERSRTQPLAVRRATYALSIVGNNLPDLDFIYQRVSGKTFGYLLQHRGYTHTVLAALGFAGLMLGALVAARRLGRIQFDGQDLRLFAWVALVSPLLHIAMDFANNYGVHPFWPLDNAWFYGDSLFIVEPALWLVIIAPLVFSFVLAPARGALWFGLALSVGALWYEPFVPRRQAAVLTVLTAVLSLWSRRQSPLARAWTALAGFVLVISGFVLAGLAARSLARRAVAADSALTLDVVATPMPANPFCWNVLLLERESESFVVRIGRVAVFPHWLDLRHCPYDRDAAPTAPLQHRLEQVGDSLSWSSEYRMPLAELRSLAQERCEVSAFLRFARVPYVTPELPDGSRVVGDLRFDRKPGLDFSDVRLPRTQGGCPPFVPPWRPPRTDVLSN